MSNLMGTAFGYSGDNLFPTREVSHAQFGAYGDVLFKTYFAPKDLIDSRRWRIERQQLVQGYPSHQARGEDERTISMTIELHNEFVDLTMARIALTDLAVNGVPRGLVVGTDTLGLFALRELTRTITETLPNGTVLAENYQLSLVETREEAGQ